MASITFGFPGWGVIAARKSPRRRENSPNREQALIGDRHCAGDLEKTQMVGFTPETGTVRFDYLGGLITGYNPRDYKGNTAFLRLLYLF
jgi:hypothetical protein